ncbi:MAG: hypothetical protein ACWGQW_20475 [bacterium]
MRTALSQAVETLSSFADTLSDEVSAPHWANVSQDQVADELMNDVAEVRSDPEGFVDDQMKEEINQSLPGEEEPITNPTPDQYNPSYESHGGDNEDEDNDWSIADWWSSEPEEPFNSQAAAYFASSSIPVETLEGPRVEHIGPGASEEEFGYFTDSGEVPSDDPAGEGFSDLGNTLDYDAVSEYDHPTDGAESEYQVAATYSWLPGADNQKLMPYYEPGLSEEDVLWMKANSDPDPPLGTHKPTFKPNVDPLWEARRQ